MTTEHKTTHTPGPYRILPIWDEVITCDCDCTCSGNCRSDCTYSKARAIIDRIEGWE